MDVRRDTTTSYLYSLAALAVGIFVALSLAAPGYLSFNNLSSMGFQFPEFGLLALAILPAMVAGGIDLSVVAVANLSAVICAVLLREGGVAASVAIPVTILAGLCCGAVNGLLISWLRLPAILATLGTMQLFGGIAIVITGGPSLTGLPAWYATLGTWSVFGILPLPLVIFAGVALVLGLVLARTRLGLRGRLYGANATAARFAGISETTTLVRTYAICGGIAALAGLVVLARVSSANPDYGSSYLLLVILINVLAGVDPNGGRGTVIGVVLAVLTLQLISSGLNFMAFSAYSRDLFYGGLLVAVMLGRWMAGNLGLGPLFMRNKRI